MNDIETLKEIQRQKPFIIWIDDKPYNKSEAIQNILKERQADKEKIKELEKQNRELNILRLTMLVGEFPDTTDIYKKYKKELDELLETH